MRGLRLGLVLAACGPLAAAAQAPLATKDRSAWAACRQAPTRVCLIDAAMSISASTPDAVALESIGKAQARAGQKDRAAATFKRALARTQARGLEGIRPGLTAGIAWAQSESGFAADAEATFALADKLAAASGDTKQLEAAQVARAIANQTVHAEALALVVRALADSGKLADAEALAPAIHDGRFFVKALADIAAAHAKTGRMDTARAKFASAGGFTQSISDPLTQVMVLADLARAEARAGLFAEAAQNLVLAGGIARAIALPVQRAAVIQVVSAYAEVGAYADAVKFARSIDEPTRASFALMATVKAEASAGHIAEAVELAQSIPAPQISAIALAETALALSQ